MDATKLFLEIVLSLVGMGYFYSGKRRGDTRTLICGLALGLFPYFVSNTVAIFLIGAAIAAVPFIPIRD